MVLRLTYFHQQRRKELIPRGIDFRFVVLERQSPVLVHEKFDEHAILIRQMEPFLLNKLQHGTLGKLVNAILPYLTFLACCLSEEEIEDNTQHGNERQHQHPRHCLGRLPVVHQHTHHHHDDDNDVDSQENPMNVIHLYPPFLFTFP